MPNRRSFLGTASVIGAGVATQAFAAPASHRTHDERYVVPPSAPTTLRVVDSAGVFPVRRVYCIGRNYLAHVEELNHDRNVPPFFFQKARDMVVPDGQPVRYPSKTQDYEHEIELVLAMRAGGMHIPVEQAMSHVYGYAVGLDMTRRDLQNAAQEKRQPWESGKSFDQAAPCSDIVPLARTGVLREARIWLTVNERVVTDGNIKDMIWNQAEIIAQISKYFSIEAGDLIYTGTPKGVGKVRPGDTLVARIEGLPSLSTRIV